MLKTYQTIDEKRDSGNFDYRRVSDFHAFLEEITSDKYRNHCFRGQKDALWKITSFAQRAWDKEFHGKHHADKKTAYWQWLQGMPGWARRHPAFFPTDIRCLLPELGDHEVLGFLQHYGFPTSLVDFSSDFATALHMAIHSVEPDETPDAFSIYCFDKEVTINRNEAYGIEEVVKKSREENSSFSVEQMFNYQCWMSTDGVFIRKDTDYWHREVAAGRMASQGGMFVHWPSERMPLETLFAAQYKMDHGLPPDRDEEDETEKVVSEIHPDYGKAVEAERCLERMTCFDIPYAFLAEAKEYCQVSGKNDDSLGLSKRDVQDPIETLYGKYLEQWRA